MTADKEKRCWGIRVENGTGLKGTYIKFNNEIIGKITSSTWSPFSKMWCWNSFNEFYKT